MSAHRFFFTLYKKATRLWALALILAFLSFLKSQPMSATKKIPFQISSLDTNKVVLKGGEIERVYGDQGLFSFDHDPASGQLFLKLVEPLEGPLTLTLVTNSGAFQDIEVSAGAEKGQTLLLEAPAPLWAEEEIAVAGVGEEPRAAIEREQRALTLCRHLLEEKPLPGYRVHTHSLKRFNTLGALPRSHPHADALSFACRQVVEGPFEVAYLYTLKNTSAQPLFLKEAALAQPGDVLIYIKDPHVEAGARTTVLIIQAKGAPHETL